MSAPMRKDSRILLTGATGLVGSALRRALEKRGCRSVLAPSRAELDLTDRAAVDAYFARRKPQVVLHAAAKVGGIAANAAAPADFLYENLAIETNVIDAAFRSGVRTLLNFSSACVYPKRGKMPLSEDSVLTGAIEPTNEAYAVAKIAGLKLCQAYNRQHGTRYLTVVPANLYGPGDRFEPGGHVISGLITRVEEAKRTGRDELDVWGSGKPRRDFLFVDDLAEACLFLLSRAGALKWDVVNVGSGRDTSIRELAGLIKETAGWNGRFVYDLRKPDGMPRRLLDNRRVASLGWKPKTSLREGLRRTWRWYQSREGGR